MEIKGVEPLTYTVQKCRSTNWAKSPINKLVESVCLRFELRVDFNQLLLSRQTHSTALPTHRIIKDFLPKYVKLNILVKNQIKVSFQPINFIFKDSVPKYVKLNILVKKQIKVSFQPINILLFSRLSRYFNISS